MKMKLLLLCCLLLPALSAFAQQTGINGVVTDVQGASVTGAKVHLQLAGGGSFDTVTNARGSYTFPSIAAGDYVIRTQMDGFATLEKRISLLVGNLLPVDFTLTLASANTTVDVVTDPQQISTSTSEIAGNIDPVQMKEVPLNGRNWLELSLLIPGIVKNDVSGNNPIAGADGGTFQINVDGQQVTQNMAGSSFGQPHYSRDALSQFQIITNRFDATQGRSLQAQINAQSKSGANNLHGTAYAYFRNDALNASDFVSHTVLPYSDQQYGGTIGGPIFRDKLWYFGSFEGERNPTTYISSPPFFGGQKFTESGTVKNYSMTERFDYQHSDRDRFSFRVAGYNSKNPESGAGGTTHPSRILNAVSDNLSAISDWNHVISPNAVNDLRLGFAYFGFSNTPYVYSQEYRFGGITVGQPYNNPGRQGQDVWSARDDLFWSLGKHNIKAGVEYLNYYANGQFHQNFPGTVTQVKSTPADLSSLFPNALDPTTWNIAAISTYASQYVQGFGQSGISIYRSQLGTWFQDDWKLNNRLTLNLGVRYDVDIGMTNNGPILKSGLPTPQSGDYNNIGPRVGFAYDLFGTHKTVIRGGAGIYYADLEANPYYDQELFNGQASIQASVQAGTGNINLAKPFGNVTADQILSGAVSFPQAVQLVQPGVVTPWSGQGSIGAAQQLGRWTVTADYLKFRTHDLGVRIDENQSLNPVTGYSRTSGSSAAVTNSNFTSILRFQTPSYTAAYTNELQVAIRRVYTNGASASIAYTLASQRSNTEGLFFVPDNQFNIADGWGPIAGDQRHMLNASGIYQLKYGFQLAGLLRFGSGVATAITAGSSPFFNGGNNRTYLATKKVYNDPRQDHPSIASGYMTVNRNSFYTAPIYRFDARLQKTFSLHERYRVMLLGEAFNLTNHPNYGSYTTDITSPSFGQPAQNSALAYAPREFQLAARFEF